MKISTILDQIDSGFMALPEFQRGFVWSREQVRGLFHSLYRQHPVGGLLVWATEASTPHRGDGSPAPGIVKLLLDGQQRMTTLYGVVRGRPPRFFDGDERKITGLRFHLEQEVFEFYQPAKMKDDPLWVDVTNLWIGARSPENYFLEVEDRHPGALASQWIPEDRGLWKMENYLDFLEARRVLLANEANRRFEELLHGDSGALIDPKIPVAVAVEADSPPAAGDSEEAEITAINDWVEERSLPRGSVGFELADEVTGAPRAMIDLAWPEGLQAGLSAPVAVLLNGPQDVLSTASAAGYRCFTTRHEFQAYVEADILGINVGATSEA